MLKKKFNDTYKSSKNLLSGSEWYCHQAFRALNQAAGRCIRHRFDYGAIILLDERYTEQRNLAYISKWLRSSIKSYKNLTDSLEGLQTFFRDSKKLPILEEDSIDLTVFINSKEKLEPLKSSYGVTPPKESQKIKKKNNHVGKIDSDISPGFQPQTPVVKRKAGEANDKILSCDINKDSENKSLKHSRSQLFSPGSSPDLPMVIGEDVKSTGCFTYREEHLPPTQNLQQFSEFPTSLSCRKTSNGYAPQDVDILSVTAGKSASAVPSDPKFENLTVFQHFHHFPEIPSSLSCGAISNGYASQDTDILAVTPEKLASPEPFDAKQDPDFVMSVSSSNQKKRRLEALQNSSYPEIHCANLCFDESTAQFARPSGINISKKINQRTEYSFEDDEKEKLELFKSKNQNIAFTFSHLCDEMELHIACLSCKNPLGSPENRFLVKSLMMLSSKIYLAYIRIYGTQSSFMLERLSKTPPTVINVLSSEIMLINELIIKGHANTNFSNRGVWCEEDGCVFKTIFCPFCKDHDTCLGVHVLATDASNVNLLNKVLFYADSLCISEPKTSYQITPPKSENLTGKFSDHFGNTKQKPAAIMKNTDNPQSLSVENEKYDCEVANNNPAFSPKQMLGAHKNADNHQSKPLEIEKFAYRPQTQRANSEKFPSNAQTMTDQTEKFTRLSQPKAYNSLKAAKSKLRLPRRQYNSSQKNKEFIFDG